MPLSEAKDQVVTGTLEPDIYPPGQVKDFLLDFVADELPHWRDRFDRPAAVAEDKLTELLCDHLNNAARHKPGLDHFRFHAEAADQGNPGRSIDLAAKPLGANLIIEGRRHSIFDTILPIECKRLPTPRGSDRDPREYVYSDKKSTGGIQRFKEGHHGALHKVAGMIGYVQDDDVVTWVGKVKGWISDLATAGAPGWTLEDLPRLDHEDSARKTALLSSTHTRKVPLDDIEIRHLWVQMH